MKCSLQLILPLIDDLDYYVQKGVGWALRETHSAYPSETKKLFNKEVLKLSSIAFTTSMEKMDKSSKEKYKELRKEARKSKSRRKKA